MKALQLVKDDFVVAHDEILLVVLRYSGWRRWPVAGSLGERKSGHLDRR